ncbi:MAG: hypothetical protein D3914_07335 [Candidatus Electrothrix sp. LOE2]|nr:hypothetical protein [Candidatus Electrothrix sp. LOE2]
MLFYEQQSISSLIGMLSFVVLTVFTTIAVFKLMPLAARRLGQQLPDRTPADVIPVILVTFFCYLLFFFHAGVLTLAVTLKFDADLSLEHAGGVLTAFSVSWIAGFLTPGSPGGIGVREAAFVASLSSFIEERHALVIAIVMRIITSGGDVAFFLMTKIHGNGRQAG